MMTIAVPGRVGSLVAAVLTLLTGTGMAGCADQSDGPPQRPLACPVPVGAVSLALGARANSPAPTLPTPVTQVIRKAARGSQPITVFRVDGEPSREMEATFRSTAENPVAVDRDFDTFWSTLLEAIGQTRSRSPEADPLTALTLAGRAASAGGTVILADSGLQTKPPLDFRDGALLDADPTEVTDFLKKSKYLPDLRDRTVLLIGIGETAVPQPPLDTRRRNNVAEIWRTIATAAGAACVDLLGDEAAGRRQPIPGDLQPVTVIPAPPVETFAPCGETVLRDGGPVGFRPDQDAFRDPAAAQAKVRELADVMKGGRQRAHLIGTTATAGTEQGRLALSRRRAEAVRQELIRHGVPGDRITTEGVGNHWPGREPDIGPGGVLIPGPAARNRSVIVQLTCPS